MVGYFGDIIFETSDKRILTFNDFKKDVAGRWESHVVIGQKPRLEFLGPENQTITFTVQLIGAHGVKPKDELKRWEEKVEKGIAEILVIGGEPLGDDNWIVDSIGEAWECIYNDGALYSANLDVTLKEYIVEM